MKVYGITGGIGSGKTTICKVFETLNIPIFYADLVGREILKEESIIEQIQLLFGKEIIFNGAIDRAKLAQIVFNDKEKLTVLNSIIHPEVAKLFEEWRFSQNANYGLKEAAILFESGSNKHLDGVVYISAPENIRIQRVVDRDKVSIQSVRERISNQWPEEQKLALANYRVLNDNKLALTPQILKLHKELTK